MIKATALLFFLYAICSPNVSCAQKYSVLIDRNARTLAVVDQEQVTLYRSVIGIGRGGIQPKRSMSDFVTPTGSFTVDLILHEDQQYNAVNEAYFDRYRDHPTFSSFINPDSGNLSKLYSNMSSLDFDGNGKADTAYGSGYIGLHSDSVVTGPKMRFYRGTPSWYSIALHGTPNETKDLGAANSGGCVHLAKDTLLTLLKKQYITVGTKVIIGDK